MNKKDLKEAIKCIKSLTEVAAAIEGFALAITEYVNTTVKLLETIKENSHE